MCGAVGILRAKWLLQMWWFTGQVWLTVRALQLDCCFLVTRWCLTLETPWTVAQLAPLSVGFLRQECEWVAMYFLKGIFPTQRLNLCLLHCRRFFTSEPLVESKTDFKSWHGHSSATCSYKVYLTSLGFDWEKAMAPHSSTLAWRIPWMEEPGRLWSMGSLRVRYDWATSLSLFTFMHWRRKWQPTPVFLPGESRGRGSLVGCRLWGRTESDTTEVT